MINCNVELKIVPFFGKDPRFGESFMYPYGDTSNSEYVYLST